MQRLQYVPAFHLPSDCRHSDYHLRDYRHTDYRLGDRPDSPDELQAQLNSRAPLELRGIRPNFDVSDLDTA